MISFIDNPIVQSAVLPFIGAVVLALLLIYFAPRLFAFASSLCFFPVAFLIAGFQLLPLNSTRKILVIGIVVTLIAQLFDFLVNRGARNAVLSVLALASVAWVLWPVYNSGGLTVVQMLLYAAFAAVLLIVTDYQYKQTNTQQLTTMVLSGTVAVIATLGASALLGQLSGALSATLGALLLVMVVTNKPNRADFMLPPAVLMAALFSLAAVIYSGLNWFSLLCLAGIPLFALIPVRNNNRWIKLSIQLVAMLPLVALAVYLAIPVVDESSGYY